MTNTNEPQPLAEKPLPPYVAGGEHVIAMLVAAVALPLIVGRALGLPAAQIGMLVNSALLVSGIATILQSVAGIPLIGAGRPAIVGLSLGALGPLLVIAALLSLVYLSMPYAIDSTVAITLGLSLAAVVVFYAGNRGGGALRTWPHPVEYE